MLFAQAREESALRCWNCCSYMSFVLVSNYMYLRHHKFKGFAVACDLFWQRCVPPLFLSWLRNTVSLLNLFWKCMGMKQEALLRLYGWHSAKRRLFCAELLRRAPASGRNRSPAFFFFFSPEGSGAPLLWRTVRTRSLTGIESHQLRSHAGRGGGAACAHTRGNSGVNLSPLWYPHHGRSHCCHLSYKIQIIFISHITGKCVI